MSGELYRGALVLVCLVGMGAGGLYLWMYKPTRWRDAWQRDASGWVLVLVLLFGWSLYRICVAWLYGPEPEAVGAGQAATAIALGLLLDAAVVYRLHRYFVSRIQERLRPTRVCDRCGGTGMVPLEGGNGA